MPNAENEDLGFAQGGGNYAGLEPSALLQEVEPTDPNQPTDGSARGPEEASTTAQV